MEFAFDKPIKKNEEDASLLDFNPELQSCANDEEFAEEMQ